MLRIRIGFGFLGVSGFGSRKAKINHKKEKQFNVLKGWILYGGLFWRPKKSIAILLKNFGIRILLAILSARLGNVENWKGTWNGYRLSCPSQRMVPESRSHASLPTTSVISSVYFTWITSSNTRCVSYEEETKTLGSLAATLRRFFGFSQRSS